MRALARFFTRIFATYSFEKILKQEQEQFKRMVAHDMEMLQARVKYLEDIIVFHADMVAGKDSHSYNPEEYNMKKNLLISEGNTIKYRRETQQKKFEEMRAYKAAK